MPFVRHRKLPWAFSFIRQMYNQSWLFPSEYSRNTLISMYIFARCMISSSVIFIIPFLFHSSSCTSCRCRRGRGHCGKECRQWSALASGAVPQRRTADPQTAQAAAEAASPGMTGQTDRPVYFPGWRACGCGYSGPDTIWRILPNPNSYWMSDHPLSKYSECPEAAHQSR